MSRIILCTSSSGLDELSIQHNIEIIRLNIKINNVNFIDGKNINMSSLSRIMIDTPNAIAKTSPTSEQDIFAQFSTLYQRGYREFFVVCISSELSQTLNILKIVKERFSHQINIYLYDTKTLNFPESVLAYEADVLLKQGASFVEIANHLDILRANSAVFFSLYDLTYIIRNKKLSVPAGFIANLLNIKPVMEVSPTGHLVVKDKVRHTKNALIKLGQYTSEFVHNYDCFIYVLQGSVQSDTDYFLDILDTYCGINDIPVLKTSCTALANHGPRGVGIGTFRGIIPRIAYAL